MMSECLFGAWKRRFPVLKNLATSVLFNLARMLEDDFNEEGSDDEASEDIIVEDKLQQSR